MLDASSSSLLSLANLDIIRAGKLENGNTVDTNQDICNIDLATYLVTNMYKVITDAGCAWVDPVVALQANHTITLTWSSEKKTLIICVALRNTTALLCWLPWSDTNNKTCSINRVLDAVEVWYQWYYDF